MPSVGSGPQEAEYPGDLFDAGIARDLPARGIFEFRCVSQGLGPQIYVNLALPKRPPESMKRMHPIPVALLVGLAALASPASGNPSVARDVPYVASKDPQQTLDIYAPDPATDRPDIYVKTGRPIVVWIHGGGWAAGDKTFAIAALSSACTERGYLFVSVNYRLFFRPQDNPGSTRPEVTIPDIEGDVAKAIRWLHDHAGDYGADPNFFFVMGHSAGAQLAALFCTDERYLQAEGLSFAVIKGCVPVDGDTFYPALQIETSTAREAAGKRPMFPDDKAERDLSAVLHVARGKGIPPFLLLHVADFPETRTNLQSEILAETLRNAGIRAMTIAATGKTHLTICSDLGRPGEPITQATLNFLDEQVWRTDYAAWGRSDNDQK
jgi:arylformamidase